MPRNLPWNRHEALKREPTAQSSSTPSTPRARTTGRTAERVVRSIKSPSTSPPPQPLTETFMSEGVEGDDKYRMVEDELLFIAGRFTAHLHAAEYHRQKQEAKAHNAATIDSISRPVVARMTPSVKAKHERRAKERKRSDGLRRALANGKEGGLDVKEAEDESPWIGTSLQGLMEESRGSVERLSGLTWAEPSTKAAARLGRAARKINRTLGIGIKPGRKGTSFKKWRGRTRAYTDIIG
ncbi:uncharacterized protein DNG_05906 [Cephalotrichum gorgonifer]|uniref:Uncharacterized protein n=1 Tax=Cephalotrichum gorgonifer TaxID=2041049 RepID=A0AAE8SW49_9PEZI|nr:uncharacterized protein DNG_05906 [Cephalotrichum gorgonifer]